MVAANENINTFVPDQMPPIERAKIFMSPKRDATRPALEVDRPKKSEKYVASVLFTVSSTPKHAAYWQNITHELKFVYPCFIAPRLNTMVGAKDRSGVANVRSREGRVIQCSRYRVVHRESENIGSRLRSKNLHMKIKKGFF